MISKKASLGVLAALTAAVVLVCRVLPRIPQPQWYHLFADRRTLFGIPNFGDVVSNLPLQSSEPGGLTFALQHRRNRTIFLDSRESGPYSFAFAGLLLTALGSS